MSSSLPSSNIQPQAPRQHQQPMPAEQPKEIAVWVKCPACGGVLGVPLGRSQGPCVFCQSVIDVAAAVALVQPVQTPNTFVAPVTPKEEDGNPALRAVSQTVEPASPSRAPGW